MPAAWPAEQVEFLEEKWGTCSITQIAKNLGKSVNAIKLKAYKLGMGNSLHSGKEITFIELCRALGKEKALTMRADALDVDAKTEFAKQLSRMELVFVPTLEAKKAYQEVVALKTTLPMELHDFEDWYESVIETTCKRCLREDYADCKTRRVLAKYGVYPIDPIS